jgi:hypothetical protein
MTRRIETTRLRLTGRTENGIGIDRFFEDRDELNAWLTEDRRSKLAQYDVQLLCSTITIADPRRALAARVDAREDDRYRHVEAVAEQ